METSQAYVPPHILLLPSGAELDKTQSLIAELENKLKKLDKQLQQERRREKIRLEEEHEVFAALLLELRSSASGQSNSNNSDEITSLESEENEARRAIRREFKDRIDALLLERRQVEEQIVQQRSLFAPIHKLNDDIFIEIFALCVYGGLSPWILTHVNTRWRALALSSETLWSGIMVTTNIDEELTRRMEGKEVCNNPGRLRRALKRVGAAPIDLDISLNWSHKALDANTAAEMIVEVCKTSAQWRKLHLENSQKVVDEDHVFPSDLFAHGLPTLKSVSFHMQHWKHALPSRGLVPFRGILDTIEQTSSLIELAGLHGGGHRDPTDEAYAQPTIISHATLVRHSPREIKEACNYLLDVRSDMLLARQYTPLFLDDQQRAKEISEAIASRDGIAPTTRQLLISRSFETSLSSLRILQLEVLDLVSRDGLHFSRNISLPNLCQLALLCGDIKNLHLLQTPNLDNLRIVLTDDSDYAIYSSRIVLEGLWNQQSPMFWNGVSLKRIKLRGVGLSFSALHSLSMANAELRSIEMEDIHFDIPDAILAFADGSNLPKLGRIEVNYTRRLSENKLMFMQQNMTHVASARPQAQVTLIHQGKITEYWMRQRE
ncbi:hypothetical protein PIIN_10004 [Serendipita indica DSM 11827]|uniref:F-box domain-containing protein n=1 Tax=Serendipita indica (strain DSM 11827) TaxID=1109443 RepID=G4TXG1_SERID|nr:hypothetical protein PIIN_10004 [Serendipita indica DSM 11827]